MQTLTLALDSFDQDNTFTIEVVKPRRTLTIRAILCRDYQKQGDGILWAMQKSACLKSHYTPKDEEERARLNAMRPLQHGDTVTIEGKPYKARILGDFSNCAIFDPV